VLTCHNAVYEEISLSLFGVCKKHMQAPTLVCSDDVRQYMIRSFYKGKLEILIFLIQRDSHNVINPDVHHDFIDLNYVRRSVNKEEGVVIDVEVHDVLNFDLLYLLNLGSHQIKVDSLILSEGE
jgi:hypothetical protein